MNYRRVVNIRGTQVPINIWDPLLILVAILLLQMGTLEIFIGVIVLLLALAFKRGEMHLLKKKSARAEVVGTPDKEL